MRSSNPTRCRQQLFDQLSGILAAIRWASAARVRACRERRLRSAAPASTGARAILPTTIPAPEGGGL